MGQVVPGEINLYADLISSTPVDLVFRPEAEVGRSVQVERGTVYPMSLRGYVPETLVARMDRPCLFCSEPVFEDVGVVDRVGHARSFYAGVLVYSWAQALRVCRVGQTTLLDAWRVPLRVWCGAIEARVQTFEPVFGDLPACRGADATAAAWAALALYSAGTVLGEPQWAGPAGECFGRLAAGQQPSGALLKAGPGDNPETWWYHELVLLHAAASYAAMSDDARVSDAVRRAADFHLNETQPDHATDQPWALHAFVPRRPTRPIADQMLHTLRIREAGRPTGLSSMLLADALYCLRMLK